MSTEDLAQVVERQRAARHLLARPLLAGDAAPEELALVQAHADWLTGRFWALLEYRLDIGRAHARLVKAGAPRTPAVLRRDSGLPFSPRAYTYLVLAIAALQDVANPIRLGQLVTDVRAAATEAGLDRDPTERRAERRACAAALLRLHAWHVLRGPSAPLSEFASSGPVGDVGPDADYQVNHTLLRGLVTHPPGRTSTGRGRSTEHPPDSGAGSGERAAGHAVLRRLAEHGVVYRDELPEEQRRWLGRHQWRATAALTDFLGGTVEIRAEGVALLMPDTGEGADSAPEVLSGGPPPVFPSDSDVDRVARELLSRLLAELRPTSYPVLGVPVPTQVLESALRDLLPGERTGADPGVDPEAAPVSTAAVLERLRAAGLVEREPDPPTGIAESTGPTWWLLAAAGRY